MPAPRTPAQAEAARRNGARSRGPVTPEGKARSSMNALRHGLAAAGDLLLEGEDRDAYEELLDNLIDELEPASELQAQLVRRLASALWRQHRADRLEAKLFAWTDTPKVFHRDKYLPMDAEAGFDPARLAAIQRYRAEASREASRILRELRLLRAEQASAKVRNEPEPAPEPVPSPADTPPPSAPAAPLVARNEPDRTGPASGHARSEGAAGSLLPDVRPPRPGPRGLGLPARPATLAGRHHHPG